jgi:hypothetical protein
MATPVTKKRVLITIIFSKNQKCNRIAPVDKPVHDGTDVSQKARQFFKQGKANNILWNATLYPDPEYTQNTLTLKDCHKHYI